MFTTFRYAIITALVLLHTLACPSGTIEKDNHCICTEDFTCVGPSCQELKLNDNLAFVTTTGFPPSCAECQCIKTMHILDALRNGLNLQPVFEPELDTNVQESISSIDTNHRDIVLIRSHVLESAAFSETLKNYGHKMSLKQCASDNFMNHMPCQIWTSNEVDIVMSTSGVPGLKFFMTNNPLIVTLLSDPIERTLHRFHYFTTQEGSSMPKLTIENFMAWFESHPDEKFHYFVMFSQGSMTSKPINNALKEIDIIGLTSHMDEFAILLAEKLAAPIDLFKYTDKYHVDGRPRVSDLSQDVVEYLSKVLEADIKIYNDAKSLAMNQIRQISSLDSKRLALS